MYVVVSTLIGTPRAAAARRGSASIRTPAQRTNAMMMSMWSALGISDASSVTRLRSFRAAVSRATSPRGVSGWGSDPADLSATATRRLDRHRNTLIASGDFEQAVGQVSPIGLVLVRLENSRKLGRDKLGECPCVLPPARTRIQELCQPRLDRRPDGAPLRIAQLTTIQGRRSEQVVDARGQMLHGRQATGGQVPSRRSRR